MKTLQVFNNDQVKKAKVLLAAQVASMMGRKLEEGDWTKVYCQAKEIPQQGWSNLHIDVIYNGLGLEIKMLRVKNAGGSLKSVCGTTFMHPSATRSIRIGNIDANSNDVMCDVFNQYEDLIRQRTEKVKESSPDKDPDMRIGWLLWEDSLTEFLYFEEKMIAPNPNDYYADWHITPAKGVRKSSKNLWVFSKHTNQKRYSVTTSAGAKIQPYFDVPAPSDANLYYFRVQSEPVDDVTIQLWIRSNTAKELEKQIGSLDRDKVSSAASKVLSQSRSSLATVVAAHEPAVPVPICKDVHYRLINLWKPVSDEHLAQLLLSALDDMPA